MPVKGTHLGILAAVLLAAGAGFAVARMTGSPSAPDLQPESAHHDDPHIEGFVALKPEDAAAAGVDLTPIEHGSGMDLLLPGRVALAVNAQSTVGAPLDGVVVQIFVAAGSKVSRGAAIASMRSPEGGAIRAEVDAAQAALVAAELQDTRNSGLFEQGAISRQLLEATRADTAKAQAQLRAAQAQALAMGSPDAGGVVVVRSAIPGVVMRVATTPGAVLDDGMEIATVADASKTELIFNAPPASVGLITLGEQIEARWTGGQTIKAEITGIAPSESGASAVVRARPVGSAPPPGTVVSGRLTGGAGDALSVPSEAVQTIDGGTSVFVAGPEGFRATRVVPGRVSNGRTEIISGLKGDEQIAGAGAFLLKAELGKSEVEHED